jgi:hypothetical protein
VGLQNGKEFVYKELNIFRETMPSSGVTWNLVIPSFVIQHVSPSAIAIISTIHEEIKKKSF